MCGRGRCRLGSPMKTSVPTSSTWLVPLTGAMAAAAVTTAVRRPPDQAQTAGLWIERLSFLAGHVGVLTARCQEGANWFGADLDLSGDEAEEAKPTGR